MSVVWICTLRKGQTYKQSWGATKWKLGGQLESLGPEHPGISDGQTGNGAERRTLPSAAIDASALEL
jgi:hypothetical protein